MSQWPNGATQWSREQIRAEVGEAWREFCGRRIEIAQKVYPAAFQQVKESCGGLIRRLPQLLKPSNDPVLIADLLRDQAQLDLLCYLTAPPVTKLELAALAGAPLDAALVLEDPRMADEIRQVVLGLLDPVRLPWLRERRPAYPAEEEEAVLVTAALAASQQVDAAYRRTEGGSLPSEAREELLALGMLPRPIEGIEDLQGEAPAPGEFSAGACLVGEEVDLLVGLFDRRLLALQCVASDAEKVGAARLQGAAQAARRWASRFGTEQLLPAVLIRGIFRAEDIEAAQAAPMVIFWEHRLDEMGDFVSMTRT